MLAATNNFLVPNATFFVELALFAVILTIVSRFILPRIQEVMEERRKEIRDAQDDAEEGRGLVKRAETEMNAAISKARRESRAIVEQATREGERQREEMRARAKTEYDERLAQASAELDRAAQQASDDLQRQVEGLVADSTRKVLDREALPADMERALREEASDIARRASSRAS